MESSFAGNTDLVEFDGVLLSINAIEAYRTLQNAAYHAGFQMRLVSGYRSFERQLSIWNRKVKGDLPVLDAHGYPISPYSVTEIELMWSILRWSALPGLSRHHWGSDCDVVGQPLNIAPVEPELIPHEYALNGVFFAFDRWLSKFISQNSQLGFVKPYVAGRGYIQPEPWHLSHLPTAQNNIVNLSQDNVIKQLREVSIELLSCITLNIEDIFTHTVVPYIGLDI